MAYLQARAGIMRSGVTHSAWAPPLVQVIIGGVVATATGTVGWESFSISSRADGSPPVARFLVNGMTPALGSDVRILYTTPNDYLFTGTLLQVEPQTPISPNPDAIVWDCTAVGYQWLMDRYDVVTGRYQDRAVNTIVGDILARFTNGGFTVGYIPSSLGRLSLDFALEPVASAINRIAKAVSEETYWHISPNRHVSMYQQYPHTPHATIDDNSDIQLDAYRQDLTQVRTRALVRGRGTQTIAAASGGATTIAVEDTSVFLSAGGQALAGWNLVTYTGISTVMGPGLLTGVSGLVNDLAEGDEVAIVVSVTDAAAQTTLATVLGAGLSGQATHAVVDDRLLASEAAGRGTAELEFLKTSLKDFDYSALNDRWLRVGTELTVSLTTPVAVSGAFRVQDVTLQSWGSLSGQAVTLHRQISTSKFVRSLTSLLKQVDR